MEEEDNGRFLAGAFVGHIISTMSSSSSSLSAAAVASCGAPPVEERSERPIAFARYDVAAFAAARFEASADEDEEEEEEEEEEARGRAAAGGGGGGGFEDEYEEEEEEEEDDEEDAVAAAAAPLGWRCRGGDGPPREDEGCVATFRGLAAFAG